MFKTLFSATKTIVSTLALVLAFTMNVSAQDKSTGAQRLTDRMKTELSLNDEQYAKVLEINTAFISKTSEARKASTDRAEVSAAIKGLNDEKDAKLKTVLTEEQYKTYITKKEQRKVLSKQNRMEDGKADAFQKATIKKS